MDSKLIETCKLFFLPASVLFTALGLAPTEGLKTGVSAIGFVISLAWFYRILVWKNLAREDKIAAVSIAGIFLVASGVSLWVHGLPFVT